MTTYDVKTDLDPDALTAAAAETYRQWLMFAMGKSAIGGKTLAHPSGRYAASLSWKKTGESSVAIIADETVAPEVDWIEEGRASADMKAAMLSGGKVAADGSMYRVVPIRDDADTPSFNLNSIGGGKNAGHLPAKIGKLWATPRPSTDAARFVTMSNRPGASDWKIPAMPAYAPAAILAELLTTTYGK